MAEQLIINLPEGVTLAELLPAAAAHGEYTAEITTQEPREEVVADVATANNRLIELKQQRGIVLSQMHTQNADGTITLRYTEETTGPNPLSVDEYGKVVIEKAFKEAYMRMVLAPAQKAAQEAAQKAVKDAQIAAMAKLEGGSIT